MKAICIDDKNSGVPNIPIIIKEGEVYDVYESPKCSGGYKVKGYEIHPNGKGVSYRKSRFIPLSNIDEMEILAERYGVYAENNF